MTLALPTAAHAKDGAASATFVTAASQGATARAELATPKGKRPRKASTQMRRVAAVAAPASYHSQCFLFLCGSGGRPFHWLVLGVAY